MKRTPRSVMFVLAAFCGVACVTMVIGAPPSPDSAATTDGELATADEAPLSLKEARGQARLLHETLHETLQIVHHRYYREDEGMLLPARILKTVFKELGESRNIQLRWLVVDGQAMNVEHKPQDEFERKAAQVLASGDEEYEQVENGVYRHAGAITLGSVCQKCHVPRRTSTEARSAGLLISIPIRAD